MCSKKTEITEITEIEMAKNGTSSSWKFNLFYFEGSLDNDEVERKKQRRKKRRKKM